MSTKERIGITLGDPSGVGPEIVARTLADADEALLARVIVFADSPILERAYTQMTGERLPKTISLLDRGLLSADKAVPGRPSEAGARAQVGYLEAAVAAIKSQSIAGLVTAPINKHEARKVGFSFPGHTDFLADRLGVDHAAMMFVSDKLKVVLATIHIPLAEVAGQLSVDGIAATVALAGDAAERDFGHSSVRIGVCGLNPHAGENGLFGREEIDIITPAIEEARRRLGGRGDVIGPMVPDAAFRRALAGECDVVVAMYHDQGLIPVKLVDFAGTVNLTLGLPVVRTSPDHGVAYDIAGTGEARADSFKRALKLACDLVDKRSGSQAGGDTSP